MHPWAACPCVVTRAGRAHRPISGTKKQERLAENLGAIEVELSPEDLERLDEFAPAGSTAGARYPDMSTIDS